MELIIITRGILLAVAIFAVVMGIRLYRAFGKSMKDPYFPQTSVRKYRRGRVILLIILIALAIGLSIMAFVLVPSSPPPSS